MEQLSKEADKLICILYKEYLERIKKSISKRNSKMFSGSEYVHESIISKWSVEDIDEICRELSRKGYIECFYGGGSVQHFHLLDDAIVYMENRFKNGLKEVMETVQLFKLW